MQIAGKHIEKYVPQKGVKVIPQRISITRAGFGFNTTFCREHQVIKKYKYVEIYYRKRSRHIYFHFTTTPTRASLPLTKTLGGLAYLDAVPFLTKLKLHHRRYIRAYEPEIGSVDGKITPAIMS